LAGRTKPDYYATAYGTQLLIEAQKAGYSVAKERLDDAVNFIERQLANSPEERGTIITTITWTPRPRLTCTTFWLCTAKVRRKK
jgi:uncharacterized protein YfaS (alpha-2-macroglobulin family)